MRLCFFLLFLVLQCERILCDSTVNVEISEHLSIDEQRVFIFQPDDHCPGEKYDHCVLSLLRSKQRSTHAGHLDAPDCSKKESKFSLSDQQMKLLIDDDEYGSIGSGEVICSHPIAQSKPDISTSLNFKVKCEAMVKMTDYSERHSSSVLTEGGRLTFICKGAFATALTDGKDLQSHGYVSMAISTSHQVFKKLVDGSKLSCSCANGEKTESFSLWDEKGKPSLILPGKETCQTSKVCQDCAEKAIQTGQPHFCVMKMEKEKDLVPECLSESQVNDQKFFCPRLLDQKLYPIEGKDLCSPGRFLFLSHCLQILNKAKCPASRSGDWTRPAIGQVLSIPQAISLEFKLPLMKESFEFCPKDLVKCQSKDNKQSADLEGQPQGYQLAQKVQNSLKQGDSISSSKVECQCETPGRVKPVFYYLPISLDQSLPMDFEKQFTCVDKQLVCKKTDKKMSNACSGTNYFCSSAVGVQKQIQLTQEIGADKIQELCPKETTTEEENEKPEGEGDQEKPGGGEESSGVAVGVRPALLLAVSLQFCLALAH